jgi:hypothetical protein
VPEATAKIHVYDEGQGRSRVGSVAVKPNLHAALRVFRHETESRRLWIDAICIDQENDEEKSIQVGLMRRIYEGSSGVVVLLGAATKDSDPAISLVRKLKDAATIAGPIVPHINPVSSQDLAKYGLPSPLSRDYPSLLSLFEAEWFHRAWIVQEVAVAKKVTLFWGIYSADWNDFISGMEFARKACLAFTAHPAFNYLLPITAETEIYRAKKCTLLGVLLRHRQCQATIPKDKIYALLGLTEKSAEPQAKVQVDYKQDLRTVYLDAARKMAAYDKSLDILSLPALPFESSIKALPSWVPDWSIPTEANAEKLRQIYSSETNSLANKEEAEYRISKPFCATNDTLYSCPLLSSHQHSILATRGHIVDTVAAVGDPFEGIYVPRKLTSIIRCVRSVFRIRRTLSSWEDVAEFHTREESDIYANGETILDAFWQTLATGNLSEEDKGEERKKLLRAEFLQISKTRKKLGQGILWPMFIAFNQSFFSIFLKGQHSIHQPQSRYMLFRRMIRTDRQRYIGLVSGNVRQGDEVWLLEGSKVPLVIRKQTEGRGRFIGDGYIHGIMYGEAFKAGDCGDLMLE